MGYDGVVGVVVVMPSLPGLFLLSASFFSCFTSKSILSDRLDCRHLVCFLGLRVGFAQEETLENVQCFTFDLNLDFE